MAVDAKSTRSPKPEPTWELVLKRNPVERIKREKAPLGIRDELPALIAAGYESVAGGGHRPPPVVGPLPRQAEDRDVHAARQAPERAPDAGEAARDRRGLEHVRARRRRARDAPEHPAPLARARAPARRLRPPRRGGDHDRRRLRRHRAQHHRLPGAGPRPGELFDCSPVVEEAAELLLRQPGLLRPPAQAQVHDRRLRRPLQRAGDQLHRARRRDPRGPRGVRRAGRRRALVGAADLARHGRLRPEGGGGRGPRRDHGRLVGRPPLPRLAGQGAPQVHDRRHRPRGHARARRGAARAHARGLRAAAGDARRPPTTWACTSRSSPASSTSARRCTSGSSRATR